MTSSRARGLIVCTGVALAAGLGAQAPSAQTLQPTPQIVEGWGINQLGELGDGTTTNSNVPVGVSGLGGTGSLSGVTAVAAGGDHTLALLSNGTVVAWGANDDGQLGDGQLSGDSETPVEVVGPTGSGTLTGVAAIAANDGYSLALLSNGTVMAWGSGGYGQLGSGSTGDSDVPAAVSAVGGGGELTDVTAIAAGQDHSLALLGDGTVVAWGSDTDGQLGDDSMTTGSDTPIQVVSPSGSGTLGGVTAIAAGQDHSIAQLSNGTAVAWGANNDGQLGDGSTTNSDIPVEVNGLGGTGELTGVTQLAAGQDHSIALLADGTVVAWGENGDGQLGNSGFPGFDTNEDNPVEVNGLGGNSELNGVQAVTAGASDSYALLANGTVLAWGEDSGGQLGNGTTFFGFGPAQVSGPAGYGTLSGVTAIASGSSASQAFALQPEPGQPTSSRETVDLGDKGFTLITPPRGACIAPFGTMQVFLVANTLKHGAKATFKRAQVYIGKGIAHDRFVHRHGKFVLVVTYTPNQTISNLPADKHLSIRFSSGNHTVTVKVTVTEFVIRHHKRVKKPVTKTLRFPFSIC